MTEAVILAAGVGKRLAPLTFFTPKPLVPTCFNTNNLLRIVHKLATTKLFKRIHIVLGYVSTPFAQYLYTCLSSKFKDIVNIVVSSKLKGTAGQLCDVITRLSDSFLVMNGDVALDEKFLNQVLQTVEHFNSCREVPYNVVIFTCKKVLKYGVIEHENGIFKRWLEKPSVDVVVGVYFFSRNVIPILRDLCRKLCTFDMNMLINLLVDKGRRIFVKSVEGEFLDIGTLDDYVKYVSMLSEVDIKMKLFV